MSRPQSLIGIARDLLERAVIGSAHFDDRRRPARDAQNGALFDDKDKGGDGKCSQRDQLACTLQFLLDLTMQATGREPTATDHVD